MKTTVAVSFVFALALAGCGRKNKETNPPLEPPVAAAPAPAPAPTPQPPATPPAPTPDQEEQAKKLAKLDYATMEDSYLKDAHAQWAASASATSSFGDDGGKTPADSNAPTNLTGAPDSKSWTNNHQDIGFDSIELTYLKPVAATEIRIVCTGREAVESITKIELQTTDGSWNPVWSGVSDVKADVRGNRTWFVKQFAKTAAPVKTVRVTFANNVSQGYKVIDAVQLVGDPL